LGWGLVVTRTERDLVRRLAERGVALARPVAFSGDLGALFYGNVVYLRSKLPPFLRVSLLRSVWRDVEAGRDLGIYSENPDDINFNHAA
jgi:hypothetical protein